MSMIFNCRCLDSVITESHSLLSQRDTVLGMIREFENQPEATSPQSSLDKSNKLTQNVNQSVEEMKQRVSKIFKPVNVKPNNLQGIFKKK